METFGIEFMHILLPIMVCVVLPVMVTAIYFYYESRNRKEQMDLLSKAIENGVDLDKSVFENLSFNLTGMQNKPKELTVKQGLNVRFIVGIVLLVFGIAGILLLIFQDNIIFFNNVMFYISTGVAIVGTGIGLALTISYFEGKKLFAAEIEAENKKAREDGEA